MRICNPSTIRALYLAMANVAMAVGTSLAAKENRRAVSFMVN